MDDIDIVPVLIQKGTTKVCFLLQAWPVHALPSHSLLIPFACAGSVCRRACLFVAMYLSSCFSLLCAFIVFVCVCGLQLALYGLGAMRDERLHRMFRQDRVKFRLPENDAEVSA